MPAAAIEALHATAADEGLLDELVAIEASFDPLPIDAAVARSYGMLAHLVVSAGRQPRRRAMDLLIVAIAHTHGVPLYARDAADLVGLEEEFTVRVV